MEVMISPHSKKSTLLLATLFILGMATVFLIVYIVAINKDTSSFVKANGVIDHINRIYEGDGYSYRPVIAYTFENVDYLTEIGTYHAGMAVGQSVGILVNPANPKDIQLLDGGFSNIVMLIVSLVCYALAVATFVMWIIKRKRGVKPSDIA